MNQRSFRLALIGASLFLLLVLFQGVLILDEMVPEAALPAPPSGDVEYQPEKRFPEFPKTV